MQQLFQYGGIKLREAEIHFQILARSTRLPIRRPDAHCILRQNLKWIEPFESLKPTSVGVRAPTPISSLPSVHPSIYPPLINSTR